MTIFKNKTYNKIFFYTLFFSVFLNFSLYLYTPFVMDTFYNISGNNYLNLLRNGRYLRVIVDNIIYFLGNKFLVPYFSLICSSIIYAYTFVILYKLFKISDYEYQILLPASIILPCFNLINPFINDVPIFAFNFLLSVLSVYLIFNFKTKFKYILFTIINIFILSTYQIAFFFSISLLSLCIINKFIDENNILISLKISFACLLCLVTCIIFYFIIIKLSTETFNSRNAGVSLFNIIKTYAAFLILPFKSYMELNETLISKISIFIIYIILFYLLFNLVLYFKNNVRNMIYVILLIIIFPVSMNSILLILKNPSRGMYQELFIIIIPYLLLSKNLNINERTFQFIKRMLFLSLIILLTSNFYTANARYQEIKNRNDAERAYVIELVSGIRQCEGYTSQTKIAFINNTPGNLHDFNLSDFYEEYVQGRFGTEYSSSIIRFNYGDGLERALNYFAAFKFNKVSNDELNKLKVSDDVKIMPIYPNYGSIKKIVEFIVVKFSEP